jgi:hypothetical protein
MMMIVEQLVECRLAEETEVLGAKLLQSHFLHHKSYMTIPGFEPEPVTNRLSYGTALPNSVLRNGFHNVVIPLLRACCWRYLATAAVYTVTA